MAQQRAWPIVTEAPLECCKPTYARPAFARGSSSAHSSGDLRHSAHGHAPCSRKSPTDRAHSCWPAASS